MIGCRPPLLVRVLLLEVLFSGLAAAEGAPPTVTITGSNVLPVKVTHEAAGKPPDDRQELRRWGRGAARRIATAYHDRGYSYARAWYGTLTDGTPRIHVDEGRMRITFTGAGSISAFFYKVDLNLPHNVFHGPTLDRAMDELRKKHGLLNIYHRVKTPGEAWITPFGRPVPQRVLQIYVVHEERFGWGFDISLSSTWGVLPGISYSKGGLLWADDRFHAKMEVAFPFRRYLFDEDPKITWVHGKFEASYRLPRWFGRRLGMRPKTSLRVSRYQRVDLDLEHYYQTRSVSHLDLIAYLQPVELGVGVGLDTVWLLDVVPVSPPPTDPPPDVRRSIRSLWWLFFSLSPYSEVLRRDQRSFLNIDLDYLTRDFQDWMINLNARGQLFILLGRHRLIARARGVVLAGQVPFFDEVQLAGDYQRVFFGNRYWIRQAVQLELAYRVNLFWDWFEAGLFHDLSLFDDRTSDPSDLGIVNAFGPSLHFLLFDMFSLAIYQGFGFGETGFDHTFSFSLRTIF